MAIKLIKACKELNIGMATLTAWCEKNGHPIASDPNVRIDDELYLLLAKEFSKDLAVKIEADRQAAERQAREAAEKEAAEAAKRAAEAEAAKKAAEEAARRAAEAEAKRAAEEAERANNVYIGDSEEKVRRLFGTPDHVGRAVVGDTETKQFVYYAPGRNIIIYLQNGKVAGFMD